MHIQLIDSLWTSWDKSFVVFYQMIRYHIHQRQQMRSGHSSENFPSFSDITTLCKLHWIEMPYTTCDITLYGNLFALTITKQCILVIKVDKLKLSPVNKSVATAKPMRWLFYISTDIGVFNHTASGVEILQLRCRLPPNDHPPDATNWSSSSHHLTLGVFLYVAFVATACV